MGPLLGESSGTRSLEPAPLAQLRSICQAGLGTACARSPLCARRGSARNSNTIAALESAPIGSHEIVRRKSGAAKSPLPRL